MPVKSPARPDKREALLARYRAMAEEGSDIIVLQEGGKIVFTTNALDRLLKRTTDATTGAERRANRFHGSGYNPCLMPIPNSQLHATRWFAVSCGHAAAGL